MEKNADLQNHMGQFLCRRYIPYNAVYVHFRTEKNMVEQCQNRGCLWGWEWN